MEAQEMLDRGGGLDELSAMYDRLVSVVEARPRARIVHVEEGNVELTYREMVRTLG